MSEQITIGTVPIIGQKKAPAAPTALIRVRRDTLVLYCGYNQLEALLVYYNHNLEDDHRVLICEATPIPDAAAGNPQWIQLLPPVEKPE